MMPAMSAQRQEIDWLDIQVLADSIPALIHTARPDGYLDYFNKRWLDYLRRHSWTKWLAGTGLVSIHPDDVDGIAALWRGCLASGGNLRV